MYISSSTNTTGTPSQQKSSRGKAKKVTVNKRGLGASNVAQQFPEDNNRNPNPGIAVQPDNSTEHGDQNNQEHSKESAAAPSDDSSAPM